MKFVFLFSLCSCYFLSFKTKQKCFEYVCVNDEAKAGETR